MKFEKVKTLPDGVKAKLAVFIFKTGWKFRIFTEDVTVASGWVMVADDEIHQVYQSKKNQLSEEAVRDLKGLIAAKLNCIFSPEEVNAFSLECWENIKPNTEKGAGWDETDEYGIDFKNHIE